MPGSHIPVLETLLRGPLFALTITISIYFLAGKIYRRFRSFILHPVLVSVIALIVLLSVLHIEYEDYFKNAGAIHFLLGPSVVALGMPLYDQMKALRRESPAILISTAFGSIVGVVSVTIPLLLMGVPNEIVVSLAPKSVTTPIAIVISEGMGGETSLTAAVVVSTGILGAAVGPMVLRLIGVVSGTPFGLAMGASAHGIGTARAVEQGDLEGASSGLAICLNGIFTSICAPPVVHLLIRLMG